MKLKINYFDNNIIITNDKVFVIEIENKKYFYRFVNDLYNISNGDILEDITFFDNKNTEINISNKINIFTNYFEFNFNSKKYQSDINKYIIENISDVDKNTILTTYKKLISSTKTILNKVELPICISIEQTIENIIKPLKININSKDDLLENLLLIIDLEKNLKSNYLLIFVNLKQYLSNNELNELYKYAIYNDIFILLIDSQCYGGTKEYENKLIIDNNLDEFMLK